MPYEDRYCSVSYKGGEIATKFHKVRIWSVMDGSEQKWLVVVEVVGESC